MHLLLQNYPVSELRASSCRDDLLLKQHRLLLDLEFPQYTELFELLIFPVPEVALSRTGGAQHRGRSEDLAGERRGGCLRARVRAG